jgi:site-specific recombinase XerD
LRTTRYVQFLTAAAATPSCSSAGRPDHTQRAYRRDILSFVDFLGLSWPQQAFRLLLASVADVQRWRDAMMAATKAPKTLNRRISSLSSFYKYLAGAAAELRLPVNLPNPAHAQFIARESSDPLEGTRALTATRARWWYAAVKMRLMYELCFCTG